MPEIYGFRRKKLRDDAALVEILQHESEGVDVRRL